MQHRSTLRLFSFQLIAGNCIHTCPQQTIPASTSVHTKTRHIWWKRWIAVYVLSFENASPFNACSIARLQECVLLSVDRWTLHPYVSTPNNSGIHMCPHQNQTYLVETLDVSKSTAPGRQIDIRKSKCSYHHSPHQEK